MSNKREYPEIVKKIYARYVRENNFSGTIDDFVLVHGDDILKALSVASRLMNGKKQ